MKLKSTIRKKAEQGIAMMIALLALLLLAAVGMGLMFMADTENSINNNYRDAQKAYFAARAGAEDVRVLLAPKGPLNGIVSNMDGVMPSTTSNAGVIYVMNPAAGEAIDPTSDPYLDNELCQEQFANLVAAGIKAGPGPCTGSQLIGSSSYFTAINPPVLSTTDMPGVGGADALAFKWVRVTNKQNLMGLMSQTANQTVDGTTTQNGLQVCWDGAKEFTIPAGTKCGAQIPIADPVWLLTSLAVTPKLGQNAGSRRMVQMEVALTPPLVPQAPIATQDPVTLQGSYVVNAYDNCSCTCTKDSSGNTTCGGAGCYDQAHAVFTAGTVTQLGTTGSTIANPNLGSPYVQNVNPWPYNIDQLINQYKPTASSPGWSSTCTGTADFFADPPVYENCGTQSGQVFGSYPTTLPTEPDPSTLNSVNEYIPGSVHLTSGTSGSGILIIDGDLQLDGGLNWYGLILVRGQVTFTGGSGSSNTGDVNLYGSILAGQDVTASNSTVSSPDGDKFGGSINFHYDVCALKNNALTRPPRLLATHELSF
jgi:hypothetical protein